jgi:hypothetical protein
MITIFHEEKPIAKVEVIGNTKAYIFEGDDGVKATVKYWLSKKHQWDVGEALYVSGRGDSSKEMIEQSLLHIHLFNPSWTGQRTEK